MTRKVNLFFYTVIFIIFGLIGYWMPLLGDDLNWGSFFGLHYIPWGIFLKYDGRYLGDLLVIGMTKFRPLAFLAYGLFMTLIVYLVQKIRDTVAPNKKLNLTAATLTTIFILIMPKLIFKQILGWHSGFANYVPSVIFPLFFLYLILKNYDSKDSNYSKKIQYWLLAASLFAQFFAEHITILNVINIIVVYGFFLKHFNENFQKILQMIFIGNLTGAFLMFINGAYVNLIVGHDKYRSIKSAGSTNLFRYLDKTFSQSQIHEFYWLALFFTIFTILLTLRINNKKLKIMNISLLLSAILAIAPFIIVSPFGSRCMFASYVFLITILIINLDGLITPLYRRILPVLLVLMVILGIRMDAISHSYGNTYYWKVQYSRYQNHAPTPRNVHFMLQYRDTKYIWINGPTQDDYNFDLLYAKHPERTKIPVSYQDWTSAMNSLHGKSFKNQHDYLKAFDEKIIQIQKKR
ncbi:DUF6056 family protein [Companilactobacillus sp.]|uniref:DUF6056 family protein n=1 Tax=Companilactobacillus sp. TaxID=2767905 RepID=UPI0025C558B3|nr:DUF6056 family protein [Companilactobacillus sp.]MCH4008935.1 DUF6056 family protein [Companilactobacillus sp.]MCH4050886.1 DUF6056 family protein [Companilactobacillus sp.]MCH4076878.1 DUF6056 family protein [Companilactobacillus sp.]MCH4125453.1 DUF6056 family protein [Companilactobacillus sp.]MCH4131995.1 DUF6056 family protein [Companilactobacillus sp.]